MEQQFIGNLVYHFPIKLDVEAMKKAVKYFEGEHDFKAFKSSGTSSKTSVRTIYSANVVVEGDNIGIDLTGNGFFIQYGKNNCRHFTRCRLTEK